MSPSRPSHASHLVEIDLKSGCKIEKCTQFKLWERCIDLKLCMLQNREMRTIKTLGEMCHRAQGLAWWRSLYESPPQHPLILSPTFAFDQMWQKQMWGKGPGVFSCHLYIYTSFLFNHWYAWGTIWICIMGNHAYRWFKLYISAGEGGALNIQMVLWESMLCTSPSMVFKKIQNWQPLKFLIVMGFR